MAKSPRQLDREIVEALNGRKRRVGKSRPQSHATRQSSEVEPGYGLYIVQGMYAGPEGILVGSERSFDEEDEAVNVAKDLLSSPYFEGDKTRVITRDGELVWNSHPARSGRSKRAHAAQKAEPGTESNENLDGIIPARYRKRFTIKLQAPGDSGWIIDELKATSQSFSVHQDGKVSFHFPGALPEKVKAAIQAYFQTQRARTSHATKKSSSTRARKKPEIRYMYRGLVERAGRGGRYRLYEGYSAFGPTGAALYPWMTKREAQRDAKTRGARAVFVSDPKQSSIPSWPD